MMRRAVLAVAILAALAAGQYIEKYIPLPDSFGSLAQSGDHNECCLVSAPALGRVLVCSEEATFVLFVDAATGARVGRLDLGGELGCTPVGYNPAEHKLYCTIRDRASGAYDLRVFDCRSLELLARIPTANALVAGFAYCPGLNKMYAQVKRGPVLAIDGAGDSVVASIIVPGGTSYNRSTLACGPEQNKLYVPGGLDLAVVDCAADSVVAVIPLGYVVGHSLFNAAANTVWCVSDSASRFEVKAIDCRGDSVVAALSTSWNGCVAAAIDTANSRVHCLCVDRLYVLRAATAEVDTFITYYWPVAVAVNCQENRVYLANEFAVHLYDGTTLHRLSYTDTVAPFALAVADDGNTLHVMGYETMAVLDAAAGAALTVLPLAWYFEPLCYNPADGRTYGAVWEAADRMLAIDGEAGRPVGTWKPAEGDAPEAAVCCSLTNRLFADCNSQASPLHVYDCAAESAIARLDIRAPLCHDDVRHVVYGRVYSPAAVVGYDCRTLAEVSRLALGWHPDEAGLDPATGRLYAWSPGQVGALDPARDSVLWTQSVSRVGGVTLPDRGNRLYVLARDTAVGHCVKTLDAEDGSCEATIPLPLRAPAAIALGSALRKVYVASAPDSSIAVIDCDRQTVQRVIRLDRPAERLLIDPGRDRLYVTLGEYPASDGMAVLDCRTDSVLVTLEPDWRMAGYGPVVLDPQHGRLFTSSGYEGGITVIRDTTPVGIAERSLMPNASRITPAATVVRGLLCLPASSVGRGASSVLLDVSGRKVLDLKAGENDVSRLAPGIYFVRLASSVWREASSVTKVVITR